MAKLIVAQFVTLDGVTEDPDGSEGTSFGGWAFRHGADAVAGDKFDFGPMLEDGLFVYGRKTWDLFSTIWPTRTDPFALALNAASKWVFSASPFDTSKWSNSRQVEGDVAKLLQDEAQHRDVVVIGSHSVVRAVQRAEIVDEYRIRVFPTAVGDGRRLFPTVRKLDVTQIEIMNPTILVIARPSAS